MSSDGYFEAVYSYDNRLLNEKSAPVDMGTYNYNPSTGGKTLDEIANKFKEHFLRDMFPYYIHKNTEKDKEESKKQRIEEKRWR